MIRVWAPSRLHFGLIHPGPAAAWQDIDGARTIAGRRYGGAGVMIDQPGVQLRVEAAREWSASSPLADRALEFARRFAATLPPGQLAPQHVAVEQAPPEHCGFGSGTQLALATARALALASGHAEWDAVELARRVGRGARSAIGTHGFQHGGFIVDGGRGDTSSIAPLIARLDVPTEWRWLLLWPEQVASIHGIAEQAAFERMSPTADHMRAAEALSRLLLLGLLPALAERDFQAFSDALHDYNSRAGELFAVSQRGRYANHFAAEMITRLRQQNVKGAGQSSWGPGVFALFGEERSARAVERKLAGPEIVSCLTTSTHHGARIEHTGTHKRM